MIETFANANARMVRMVHTMVYTMGFFSHFYFYLVTFILVRSQRQDTILRCNLLFGPVGQFGLLKYINILLYWLGAYLCSP